MIPRGAPTKEISRVILDREDRRRDLYALGSSKVFMREELEKKLENERQAIMAVRKRQGCIVSRWCTHSCVHQVEVVKVQRHVRGYLARKRYNTMKDNATKIQSYYRGYQVRKDYNKIRKGVVALQAVHRCVQYNVVNVTSVAKCEPLQNEAAAESLRRDEGRVPASRRVGCRGAGGAAPTARRLGGTRRQQEQAQHHHRGEAVREWLINHWKGAVVTSRRPRSSSARPA